jgi:hypothetical protein
VGDGLVHDHRIRWQDLVQLVDDPAGLDGSAAGRGQVFLAQRLAPLLVVGPPPLRPGVVRAGLDGLAHAGEQHGQRLLDLARHHEIGAVAPERAVGLQGVVAENDHLRARPGGRRRGMPRRHGRGQERDVGLLQGGGDKGPRADAAVERVRAGEVHVARVPGVEDRRAEQLRDQRLADDAL